MPVSRSMAKRPTLLDLAKAARPLGEIGRIECPNCTKVWSWDLDLRREIEVAPSATPEFLNIMAGGYRFRIMHEIIQHFQKEHPGEEA